MVNLTTQNAGAFLRGGTGVNSKGGDMEKTIIVTLLRGCVCGGAPHNKGDIVEVSEADARFLINTGSAQKGAAEASKSEKKGK